jgi:hypothetical protein
MTSARVLTILWVGVSACADPTFYVVNQTCAVIHGLYLQGNTEPYDYSRSVNWVQPDEPVAFGGSIAIYDDNVGSGGVLFVYDSPGAGIDEYMTSLFDLQFVDGAYVISSFPECSIQP